MNYTREQAEQVHKDWKEYHLQHDFTFRFEDFLNEKFKPQLEVGKWYKNQLGSAFLVLELLKNNRFEGCSVVRGCWQSRKKWDVFSGILLTLMTKAEVFEMLVKEAQKRGYEDGNYKCLKDPSNTYQIGEDANYYLSMSGNFWMSDSGKDNQIFDRETGEWAQIIDPIQEEIKELENRIKQLKSKQCK